MVLYFFIIYNVKIYNKRLRCTSGYYCHKLYELGPYAKQELNVNADLIKKLLLSKIINLDYNKINKKIEELTRKEDILVLNKDYLTDIINNFGKGDFLIKYKENDDNWGGGGGNSGGIAVIGLNNDIKNQNKIESMSCIECEKTSCQSIKGKIKGIEELKDKGFEENVENKENISKLKYLNNHGREIFVLERKTHLNSENYDFQNWHFYNDFNKESAVNFIKQYDKQEKEKSRKNIISINSGNWKKP